MPVDDDRTEVLRHLRRVHFTLVLTSFSLIVAATLPPEIDFRTGQSQLAEVEVLAKRMATWSWGKDSTELLDYATPMTEGPPA